VVSSRYVTTTKLMDSPGFKLSITVSVNSVIEEAPGMGFEPMRSRGALVCLPLGLKTSALDSASERICPNLATPAQKEMIVL